MVKFCCGWGVGGLKGEGLGVGIGGFGRRWDGNGQLFHVEQFEIASNDAP